MTKDSYYRNMEEDAFDVVVQYINATELIGAKDFFRKGGRIDMCTAITKLIADGRDEGIRVGRDEKTERVVSNMILRGMTDADIRAVAECGQELVDEIRCRLKESRHSRFPKL
ncbi:MAG: hypothetical protein HFI42_00200 [Lachnospiraceae bacterium]|nr:hypothetical protein [Lachnospiraceae bacterium]